MNITHEQAIKRLDNPNNLANRFGTRISHIEIRNKGRRLGDVNLTDEQRNEIAVRSRLGEKQTDLAREYGTSQPNVSNIERGEGGRTDEARVERQLSEVRDIALGKLMLSLGLITEDKLQDCGADTLARVAAHMSKVIEKSMPRQDPRANINLVIYTPEMKKETGFKVVEI
jgi:transcriptional regulator with XRE-family HTH domain